MRVFEAESLLGSVFLQVGELLAVDGSATLPESDTEGRMSHQKAINLINLLRHLFIQIRFLLCATGPQASSHQRKLASPAFLTCLIRPRDGTAVR